MGALKIYTNWFAPHEFPKVSGFMIAVGNLGSIGATLPLARAIGLVGWRATFAAVTVVQLAITLAAFLLVRNTPATDGMKQAAQPDTPAGMLLAWKTLFVTPAVWLVSLMAFFWYANYMVLLALWGGPYLREAVGLGSSSASTLLLCISFGYICGSLLLGKAIDLMKGSLPSTMIIGQSVVLLAMTAMLGPAEFVSRTLLGLIYFVIGFASASGVLIYPLARELVPHRYAATAMTFVNFFLLMGAAASQHTMGLYIHSFPRTPSGYPVAAYHGAFLIPICGLAVSLALFAGNRKRFVTAPRETGDDDYAPDSARTQRTLTHEPENQ